MRDDGHGRPAAFCRAVAAGFHAAERGAGRGALSFYFSANGSERRERVLELLDLIELGPKYAERYPFEISGGEKQRVCIARALGAKPDLIICDEVTSALDRLVAQGILKLLERLQADLSVSYLFITHDLALVKSIADKVIIMQRGRVIEQGSRCSPILIHR